MDERTIGERWMALFLVGVLAFSPPLLLVFNVRATLFGIPALYLYMFFVWTMIIAVAALISTRSSRGKGESNPSPPKQR